MERVRSTKEKKNALDKSSIHTAGTSKSIHTHSTAKQTKDFEHIGLTSMPVVSAPLTYGERAQYYKEAADELYWRYRALQRINQNLLSALTMAGVEISQRIMDPTYNGLPSTSARKNPPTTLGTGTPMILRKNSDYKQMEKDAERLKAFSDAVNSLPIDETWPKPKESQYKERLERMNPNLFK